MTGYEKLAAKARKAAAAAKTEAGRRRALNRAADYDAMAARERHIAEQAATLAATRTR